MIKECSICHTKNTNYSEKNHYCVNCGHNLSDIIELSDIATFFYKAFIIVGIVWFAILFFIIFLTTSFGFMAIQEDPIIPYYFPLVYPASIILIGVIIKILTRKACKKNIDKNKFKN